jgi:hypothetical protein
MLIRVRQRPHANHKQRGQDHDRCQRHARQIGGFIVVFGQRDRKFVARRLDRQEGIEQERIAADDPNASGGYKREMIGDASTTIICPNAAPSASISTRLHNDAPLPFQKWRAAMRVKKRIETARVAVQDTSC